MKSGLSKLERDRRRQRVSVDERRARDQREENLRRTREAGSGSLAQMFGIVKRDQPAATFVKPTPAPAKAARAAVNRKHQDPLDKLLALKPGQSVEWIDAPPRNVVHTRLTDWRRRLGLKLEAFESCGRRFIRRSA